MAAIIERILVFTINFVLWASGILLIVFGSIALASPSTIINLLDLIAGVSYVTAIFNVMPLFEGVSIFMIVLGCLLFLFGGVGCHGGAKRHRRSLMSYWLLLITGVLTEIALIIYAAVYPGTMTTWVDLQMYNTLQSFQPVNITNSGAINYASSGISYGWENLQFQSQCCGTYNATDYASMGFTQNYTINGVNYQTTIPPSCCMVKAGTGSSPTNVTQLSDYQTCLTAVGSYNSNGCSTNVNNMIYQFNLIAIIISSCLLGAQLLGIIFTVHLWHRLVKEEGGI